ncbi:hypothetical protein M9H77_17969 [Catharanthus roseus]|uniref:Uncharacterized protein n=1 Tax=Catharanthus roseus TaxID=4058 RepID=A0ACC0B640_CATRO|nr:hypothetical protein M9H77_17969 [Catharanthus roseus]
MVADVTMGNRFQNSSNAKHPFPKLARTSVRRSLLSTANGMQFVCSHLEGCMQLVEQEDIRSFYRAYAKNTYMEKHNNQIGPLWVLFSNLTLFNLNYHMEVKL